MKDKNSDNKMCCVKGMLQFCQKFKKEERLKGICPLLLLLVKIMELVHLKQVQLGFLI